MGTAKKSLIFFSILLLTLVVQETRIATLRGVQPNLFVIVALLGVFAIPFFREAMPWYFFIALLSLTGVSFFWFPFWSWTIALLGGITSGVALIKPFLSGNTYLDFLFGIAVVTLAFYVIHNTLSSSSIQWYTTLEEIIYNVALGSLLWVGYVERGVKPLENNE